MIKHLGRALDPQQRGFFLVTRNWNFTGAPARAVGGGSNRGRRERLFRIHLRHNQISGARYLLMNGEEVPGSRGTTQRTDDVLVRFVTDGLEIEVEMTWQRLSWHYECRCGGEILPEAMTVPGDPVLLLTSEVEVPVAACIPAVRSHIVGGEPVVQYQVVFQTNCSQTRSRQRRSPPAPTDPHQPPGVPAAASDGDTNDRTTTGNSGAGTTKNGTRSGATTRWKRGAHEWKRFSDFEKLHQRLTSAYDGSHLQVNVPSLPPKLINPFKDQHTDEFIQERRLALEAYLARILTLDKASSNLDVMAFFDMDCATGRCTPPAAEPPATRRPVRPPERAKPRPPPPPPPSEPPPKLEKVRCSVSGRAKSDRPSVAARASTSDASGGGSGGDGGGDAGGGEGGGKAGAVSESNGQPGTDAAAPATADGFRGSIGPVWNRTSEGL